MAKITKNKHPRQAPQGLPETEEQKLKRLQEEADLKKIPAGADATIGSDTTGVGAPTLQPINQGQSLPQSAITVERKFEKARFYDPRKTEALIREKEQLQDGAEKTDGE
jgi:hypothetical protein